MNAIKTPLSIKAPSTSSNQFGKTQWPRIFVLASLAGLLVCSSRGQALNSLLNGSASDSPALAALTQDQVGSGLKEALSKGVETAIKNLGHAGGFLNDRTVYIPMPGTLQKVEKTLRTLGQGAMVDNFVTSMNKAAEQAVPEAVEVLANSVKQMSVADAKNILTGSNTAATAYFRRTSETTLHERFLPIVKKATDAVGVTKAYKAMTEKVNTGGLGSFGGFGQSTEKKDEFDVDSYVTRKALDGLFIKIADQEKQIRSNPAARTTDLLQKVFGAANKY